MLHLRSQELDPLVFGDGAAAGRLTPEIPEMTAADVAAMEEHSDILAKVRALKRAIARRRSTPLIDGDLDTLHEQARSQTRPRVCFVNPSRHAHLLSAWNSFARRHTDLEVLHLERPSAYSEGPCIAIFNNGGRAVLLPSECTESLLQTRGDELEAVYALSQVDDSMEIPSLDALDAGERALVYDASCAESRRAMFAWRGKLLAIGKSPCLRSCIALRDRDGRVDFAQASADALSFSQPASDSD